MDYLICKKSIRITSYLTPDRWFNPFKNDIFRKGEKYKVFVINPDQTAIKIENKDHLYNHYVHTWFRLNRNYKKNKILDLSYEVYVYKPSLMFEFFRKKKKGVYVWDYFATEQDYIKILRKEKLEKLK